MTDSCWRRRRRSGRARRSSTRPRCASSPRAPQAWLSVDDARRHAIESGDEIELATGGDQVNAVAVVRTAVPEGSVFLSPPAGLEGPVEIRSREAVAT